MWQSESPEAVERVRARVSELAGELLARGFWANLAWVVAAVVVAIELARADAGGDA